MMLNVTFNNILLISWQSVLLVEETGVPGEATDLPQVTDKLDHMYLALGEILTYTFRDDRYLTYICSYIQLPYDYDHDFTIRC